MWQPELIGMAAAIWPALFCLIESPRADLSNKLRGRNFDGPDSPNRPGAVSSQVEGV
jgi:hypothetical protein